MLKYNVGDAVRYRCRGEHFDMIKTGRIMKTDENSAFAYMIRCKSCYDIEWYTEMSIIGPDLDYKSVWLERNNMIGLDLSYTSFNFCKVPGIKKVIFNNPATIVLWTDGTKTVVKARAIKTVKMAKDIYYKLDVSKITKYIGLKPGQMYKAMYKGEMDSFIIDIYDEFDPEKGLAMAIAKKVLGNKGSYYDEFKKWLPKEE